MSVHHTEDDGPTRSLRAIEAGGRTLIMTTRQRIATLLDELDAGNFRKAHDTAGLIITGLQPLANAEAYMAIAGNTRLLKARELQVGLVLAGVGEITECEVTDCPAENCPGHVKFKVGTHEGSSDGDAEFYVRVDDEPGD